MRLFSLWNTKKLTDSEEKEAILDIFGEEKEYNRFYKATAGIYRVFEFLFLTAFLVFIVASAFGNSSEVTYDNFEYLVRNFAFRLRENNDALTEILYNPDTNMTYSLYGEGMAVSGNSGVSIFSATGRRTGTEINGYVNPVLTGSDKYLLVYDCGSGGYTVYNSFSDVHTETLVTPIYGAAAGADGSYALITSAEGYTTAVVLYDRNFRQVNRYLKNGHVVSAALDGEGHVLIATLSVESNGDYSTELMLCTAGSDTSDAVLTVYGGMPLRCGFSSSGFYLLCNDRLVCYNGDALQTGVYSFDAKKLKDAAFSDDCAVLLFGGDVVRKTNTVVIISSAGEEIYSETITGTVISVSAYGERAYILTTDAVMSIGRDGSKKDDYVAVTGYRLLAFDNERLYICSPSGARVFTVN